MFLRFHIVLADQVKHKALVVSFVFGTWHCNFFVFTEQIPRCRTTSLRLIAKVGTLRIDYYSYFVKRTIVMRKAKKSEYSNAETTGDRIVIYQFLGVHLRFIEWISFFRFCGRRGIFFREFILLNLFRFSQIRL